MGIHNKVQMSLLIGLLIGLLIALICWIRRSADLLDPQIRKVSKFQSFGIPHGCRSSNECRRSNVCRRSSECHRSNATDPLPQNKGSQGSQKSRSHENRGFRDFNDFNPLNLDLTSAPRGRIMPPPIWKYLSHICSVKKSKNDQKMP